MMTKSYFVKVSYIDPNQPLIRIHKNDAVDLDLSESWYSVLAECRKQTGHQYDDLENFTIDFMIQVS